MLQLFIDGKEVTLSNDTSFEFFRENPFSQNSGDYTYDLDINLKHPKNAIVYSGISRVNNRFNVSNREAILKDGCLILCKGTEVILEKNANTVKIQIVAGNSELNYVVSNDDMIRDLDLGTIPEKSKSDIVADIDKIYPEVNVAYPPLVLVKSGESNTVANKPVKAGSSISYSDSTTFRPQPFLLYYVERVLTAIGYTVTSNYISNIKKWKRLIVVNGYDTKEYSKMLPNWTVKQFVEELEKFFNCVFIVDSNKNVIISDVNTYYENQDRIYYFDEDAVDSFSREYNPSDDAFLLSISGIEYDLPNYSLDWKLADIDDTVWKKVTVVDKAFDYIPTAVGWDNYTVYHDTETDTLYKVYKAETESSVSYFSRGVNFYKKTSNEENGESVKMSIVPALISVEEVNVDSGSAYSGFGAVMQPITSYYEYNIDETGFYEAVNGESVQNEVQNSLETTFYMGKQLVRIPSTRKDPMSAYYVFCQSNRWHCGHNSLIGFGSSYDHIDGYDETWDLSPKKRLQNDFSNSIRINTEQKYTFVIKTKQLLDPKYIFQIKGKRFICVKLTYRWNGLVQQPCVEGEFYEIK